MLHVEQLINAAVAAYASLQMKSISGPGFNLGPFTYKADRHSTTELLGNGRALDPVVLFKAYSMQRSTGSTFTQCCIEQLHTRLLLDATI